MTDSKRIAHIDELIRLGKGDLGRLEHIKESIENGKTLYNSDRMYIESLEKSHLLKDQSKTSDASKPILDQSEASDILSESIKIKSHLSDVKPKNKDNAKSVKINDENMHPVSIFWAFFFALTIFALIWTVKFKTTLMWTAILIPSLCVIILHVYLIYFDVYLVYNNIMMLNNLINVVGIVTITLTSIFMYKWATRYNIKQFGYATKQEWLINRHEAKPLSIFWACFFAHSIFALIWTIDFKTTRKWIMLSVIPAIVYYISLSPFMIYEISFYHYTPLVLVLCGSSITMFVVLIYFMYKWATRYNIKQFGCTTKQEWLIDHHEAKPVSRFWACFFANSIFALIWAMDFKTTREWTVISIISAIVCCISLVPFMIFVTSLDNSNLSSLMSYFDDVDPLMLVSIVSGIVVSVVPRSYFMYKWATRYNLKNFSYASRKEWLNAMGNAS